MTTVVADRTGMASDSQITDDSTVGNVCKVWRVRGWLVGGGGTYTEVVTLVNMLRLSKKSPVEALAASDLSTEDADLMLLSPAGMLYYSENGWPAMLMKGGRAALGTGAQGALTALALGCTPAEAVRAVKKVDPSTGGRVIFKARKLK